MQITTRINSIFFLLIVILACGTLQCRAVEGTSDPEQSVDDGTGGDADGDADGDSDDGSDSDVDEDTGGDTDSDMDGDTDGDTDSDVDGDVDGDADSDSDTHTGTDECDDPNMTEPFINDDGKCVQCWDAYCHPVKPKPTPNECKITYEEWYQTVDDLVADNTCPYDVVWIYQCAEGFFKVSLSYVDDYGKQFTYDANKVLIGLASTSDYDEFCDNQKDSLYIGETQCTAKCLENYFHIDGEEPTLPYCDGTARDASWDNVGTSVGF